MADRSLDYYREVGRSILTGEAPALDWTQESARRAGLPEEFWRYALGRETGGMADPITATSPAGAMGTAQLMPSTAADIKKRHGIDTSTPFGNVLGGATYMREMLDKAQSWTPDAELQHRLALSAYNAGPTRVSQLINDLRSQGLPLDWQTISTRLPGETQSYAGRYTYRAPASGTPINPEQVPDTGQPTVAPQISQAPPPQLPPPPALSMAAQPPPQGLSANLRSAGEFVEKAYELPVIKQFGEVMGAQRRGMEEAVYKPAAEALGLPYQEESTGAALGARATAGLQEAGVPGPLAGLAGAGASFFTDMYTDPLYWELTAAGAALGSAFGGVGAVPGGALGFLAAAGGRLLQAAPRLARGLTTGLKVAQTGFRTQMALQAASQAPRGLAEIIENPYGAEGWKNLGEAGLAGWYTAHDFLRKPATQAGRVKVSEIVGGDLIEMDPRRAREVLSQGSLGDVVDLIDAGVQEKWLALADAGWVPRMALPEFHAYFDPGGTGNRARGLSEPGEHFGRLGVDLGHLAGDLQNFAPQDRAKAFVKIVNEVVNHEVSHLLDITGMPHDTKLPADFRQKMGELRRLADMGSEGGLPFEEFVRQRDALMQEHGITSQDLYGDQYSIAREIADTESPQNAIGRHLARILKIDPDQFVRELKNNAGEALAKYDLSPLGKIVDGLQAGVDAVQKRTLQGQLRPTFQAPPGTPEEVIARMGGVKLRGPFEAGGLGVEPTAGAPSLERPPQMRAEGEEGEAGRRGFRFGPTTKGGAEALRGAAVHPRFAAWTREGRVAATPEKPLKTKPTPTTGKPTEEMFEPEAKPVKAAPPPEPGEVLDRASLIKAQPKIEKGRGARTLNVEDILKGKMRAEGESNFGGLPKEQQEQVVEELHNRKEITDQEYYAALDRIDRGWDKPTKGVIPQEEPTPMAPARRLTPRELKEETAGRVPSRGFKLGPPPIQKEAERRAQLESKTGQAVSKMQAFGMWGRLSPEQKRVKREAAAVTARGLARTPAELEAERMRTKQAEERRIPTDDAFRIVLERIGGRRIDLTDKDRETIRYELGVTPTEAKVYQVTNKWAREPEAPARRAPVRGVRELGPRARAREIMRQVVSEHLAKRAEREKGLPPPPAAKPEEMTDAQARARLKEIEAKLKMRAEGEGDTVELYSGGGSDFWTTNPKRAASFGKVRKVRVPTSVFEEGKVQARKLGQPSRFDTVLPNEWAKRSTEAPEIQPDVYEISMRAEGEKEPPSREEYLKSAERIGAPTRGERFRASVNIPLTPQGRLQAEAQGRQFAKLGGFNEIYHDNQIRTKDTALAFKKAMPDAKIVDLGERAQSQALGHFEGEPVNARTLAEMQRLVENPDERPTGRNPESTRDPETFNEFLKRYLPVIDELHARAEKEGIAIALVTHNRNIQTENARLAKEGEEGRGRSVDPEVMKQPGPDVGTVNKVIDHATQDWTGKKLEPGLYLVRHAQTAWNPPPAPRKGLPPPPKVTGYGEVKPVARAKTLTSTEAITRGPRPGASKEEVLREARFTGIQRPGLIKQGETAEEAILSGRSPQTRKERRAMMAAAKRIGVTEKRASAGTKTRSVADILTRQQMELIRRRRMRAEGELRKEMLAVGEEKPKPTPEEAVPEWLRSAALRSQRMALRKALKEGPYENASWEDTKKAFYEGKLPTAAADPMNRLIGIGAQPAEVEKLPGVNRTDWDRTWEILGAPRALITSLDLSGILRQGAIGTAALLVRHPLELGKAIAKSVGALRSEVTFHDAMTKIESSDDYHALKAMGIDFAKQEEQFTGERYVAQVLRKLHVPDFVRASDRAYSYYLTRLRYELGKHHIDSLRRMGFVDAPVYERMESGAIRTRLTGKDAEVFKKAGQWVNIATGRGGLPQGPSKFARTIRSADGFLNSVLFSPRLMYSRLALFNPLTYTRVYSAARKAGAGRVQASRALWSLHAVDMASYFGLMMGMGAALTALNPDSKLESDMLSSDFGQIRMGNTRIDVTGGTRTYITALARLILRQTKTEYGNIKYQSAYDTLTNFMRGKFSPTMSLAVNLAAGENLVGQPMYATLRDVFEGKTPLDKESVQKIMQETGGQIGLQTAVPMILADAYKLVEEHGWSAPQTIPLMGGLVLGVGVSTREPIEGATKELQDVMRGTLVSPLQRQGKVGTGVKDLLGQSINVDLSERQKDEIEKLVNVPTYQMMSTLVESPGFKRLPPEAQRMVLISILAEAKKLQRPYGLMKLGPEAVMQGIQEGLVPEEFERLSPPPAYARSRRTRPTDIRSWLSAEAGSEEEAE